MSLIRPEDYLPNSRFGNYYWNQLLQTVDQFDQLMEIEKRQIAKSISDFQQKRAQLVKQFSEFKESLRFQGEVQKRQIQLVDMGEIKHFFKGYHVSILDIIEKILLQPHIIAQLLSKFPDSKIISFQDFFQNLAFNIYPCYLSEGRQDSLLIQFVSKLLQLWAYSVDLTRPIQYTLVDQAISVCMKAPVIVCYVERIASRFLKQASSCNMATFAFDREAINSELISRTNSRVTFASQGAPKKSSWTKFKNLFGLNKQQPPMPTIRSFNESQLQDASMLESFAEVEPDQGLQVHQLMKKRQTQFYQLVISTIQSIISQQVPLLLCQIMTKFDAKLTRQKARNCRMKHYCYFIMTNLILSQLHNKFTISYQDEGMTSAHLQNISEIIKILNCVFQGLPIDREKYFDLANKCNKYTPAVEKHYQKMLERGQTMPNTNQQLLTKLLAHYQRSPVVSLNDLRLLVSLLKQSPNFCEEGLLDFLKIDKNAQMFDPSVKQRAIKFKNGSYTAQHIYFSIQSKTPSIKEVIQYYLTADQPLATLPFIREILLSQSNLQLKETLEIQQQLKVAQRVPMKQLKGFISRLSQRYPSFKLKDDRQIKQQFQESFRETLSRSLKRKEWLLYYRSELGQRLARQGQVITFFTEELNSAQFYQRMANTFFLNPNAKLYLSIENDLFVVHKTTEDLRKLQIGSLMVARDNSKPLSNNQNYILRNSFKTFQTIKDLTRCIARNEITRAALANGRRTDQFNQTFQQICQMIVQKMGEFLTNRKIIQSLSQEKLALIVIKRMQDHIYTRFITEKTLVDYDRKLLSSSTKVNKQLLWIKQLAQLGLDKQFLVGEGVNKFKTMIAETNVNVRMKHFAQLFKILLTVIGFTLARDKISAQILNPLVQYIILQCSDLPHYGCLFSLQSLLWRQQPQDKYNLTVYQSSLTYIKDEMPSHYPLT